MQLHNVSCEVLGLTGNAATGKDYLASQFASRGFIHISTGDILREIITSHGQTANRALQTQVANEIRTQRGGDFFVVAAMERALEKYRTNKHRGLVLSGLYAPIEGIAIKQIPHSKLIEVVQSRNDNPEERFRRLSQRCDGSRDSLSYEEFLTAYHRENSGKDINEANIARLSKLADYCIVNDGDQRQLSLQVDAIIGKKS